jgi:hypothetical protein
LCKKRIVPKEGLLKYVKYGFRTDSERQIREINWTAAAVVVSILTFCFSSIIELYKLSHESINKIQIINDTIKIKTHCDTCYQMSSQKIDTIFVYQKILKK